MIGLGGIIDRTAGDEHPSQKVSRAMVALEAHVTGQGLALGLLLGEGGDGAEILGGGVILK